MGFHWDLLAVRSESPSILPVIMQAEGLVFRELRRDITLREAQSLQDDPNLRDAGVSPIARFGGWTFFLHWTMGEAKEASDLARKVGADVVYAAAESISWSLIFWYAKPDGTLRVRQVLDDASPDSWKIDVVVVPDGWDIRGREPKPGEEKMSGDPLPGEPPGLTLSDGDCVLALVEAVGVPFDEMYRYFDGPGANERVVSVYGCFGADQPEPRSQQDTPARLPSKEKKGFFSRLFGS